MTMATELTSLEQLSILLESYCNKTELLQGPKTIRLSILLESYCNYVENGPTKAENITFNSPRVLLQLPTGVLSSMGRIIFQFSQSLIATDDYVLSFLPPEGPFNSPRVLLQPGRKDQLRARLPSFQFSQSLIATVYSRDVSSGEDITFNSPRVLLQRLRMRFRFRQMAKTFQFSQSLIATQNRRIPPIPQIITFNSPRVLLQPGAKFILSPNRERRTSKYLRLSENHLQKSAQHAPD